MKQESKTTPAPWYLIKRDGWYQLTDDKEDAIRRRDILDFTGSAKAEENAQLAAAAPDMLEALKGLIRLIDESGIYFSTQETFAAKAAISKAEGK